MKLVLNIEPKPQSRPRFASRGKFVTAYEDKAMKSWRERCRLLIAHQCMGLAVLEGALRAKVWFYITPPRYVAKRQKNQEDLAMERLPVAKKPDLDNYLKALFDSANGILYQDDGQIAEVWTCKRYSLNPRIEIDIEEVE